MVSGYISAAAGSMLPHSGRQTRASCVAVCRMGRGLGWLPQCIPKGSPLAAIPSARLSA